MLQPVAARRSRDAAAARPNAKVLERPTGASGADRVPGSAPLSVRKRASRPCRTVPDHDRRVAVEGGCLDGRDGGHPWDFSLAHARESTDVHERRVKRAGCVRESSWRDLIAPSCHAGGEHADSHGALRLHVASVPGALGLAAHLLASTRMVTMSPGMLVVLSAALALGCQSGGPAANNQRPDDHAKGAPECQCPPGTATPLAAPSGSAQGTPPTISTATCYDMYRVCAERCDPRSAACLCRCHNELASCTTPAMRRLNCPLD